MKKILLFLILMLSLSAFAYMDLRNDANPDQSYNVLYPTYFDPAHPENQPVIFDINISGDIPDLFYLKFNMDWRGESLVNDGAIEVERFPGGNFTNRDMIDDSNTVFESQGFSWEDILTNNSDFQDQILQTGSMPDGHYVLSLEAFDEYSINGNYGTSISNEVSITIDIAAPTSIMLISPGTPLGLGSMSITDMYPTFVWYSDMDGYTVRLFELTDEYISQEEIEYLDPLWEVSEVHSTTFPYPSGITGLSENKIYAWQVIAGIYTPYGTSGNLKSDVYIFNTFTDKTSDMDTQALLNFFYQLNVSDIDEIIQLIESGYGFDTIIWDGREINLDELRDIIELYLSGNIDVKSLTVE